MTGNLLDGKIVVPGDVFSAADENFKLVNKIKLGPGLTTNQAQKIIVCKSGTLRYKSPDTLWVDCHQQRYIPSKGENVIGVITSRQGDFYKVDIGASDQAVLNCMSFEGASKRNRPNVSNGDVVFGQLIVANKDVEPELSCIDPSSGKANGMGILSGDGILFTISLNLGRKLLSPDCVLLPELGSHVSFEIIIGLNGKVALFCKSAQQSVCIMNLIKATEYMSNTDIMKALNKQFF
ncbi:unnamed protein product [Clavelina lepadiformis]|uniref:Ribosomal RNA-processing protein 40 n=1 Tax=Clavelina lepadiformis TaxID=159417 RepID=A0ABP0G159_CLALP